LVLCVKVEKGKAEKIRQQLAANGMLDNGFVPAREGESVFFPVKKGAKTRLKLAEKKLQRREEFGKPLKGELEGKLTQEEMKELVGSFDIVGDIAVVEIPDALVKKQRLVANAILKNHHNIKVVAKKSGGTAGEFRIRPVKVIAGEKRTHTLYREGGCEFELDLNKTYFSPRLGTERGRIAAFVKQNEHVLVPFAGVGPFAIRIGKSAPSVSVVGVELNPDAADYFGKNIARNRCKNVQVICGDVQNLLPKNYAGWADRVAMPLPKDGREFLPCILPCLKREGVLHYYSFGETSEPFADAEEQVKAEAAKLGRKATILFRRVVRPYSKTTVQIVVDAKIC
jgi:tRNA (guanine37-N1)-methyltransferase